MGFHTFDHTRAQSLEDATRFRFCSREELLGPLPRGPDATVLDVGSGTGFYTDEIAPSVGRVAALDVQSEMHELYREKGIPENVSPVTANAESLPLVADAVDGAFSTMTFHESTTPESLADLQRVLAADAPFVVVDWSREGSGDDGPPVDERFSATRARELLVEAGFTVESAQERSETFRAVAHA
ncbi:class I SAM-dependent methyltransferase [Salinibaculum rarum]|uniref:class I SAM-dependent methyltransferase n=1 Tax=Salinibaculum rarum TaxID=3058903 RepID=UPI00265F8824|nr:class I SAM-dependent methyltransferase [Salinibaculum sp. KK48]